MREPPLLAAVVPGLAEEVEAAFRELGEDRLAESVGALRITSVCRCGQPYCASFWTCDRPMKRWFMRGRQVSLDAVPGEVTANVVRDEIAYVEVLHRDDVRDALALLS